MDSLHYQKKHQTLLQQLFKFKIQFIIRLSDSQKSFDGADAYQKYIKHLYQKREKTEEEDFESPYYDYLQTPLQPLQDNLESQTYDIFEKDPVKYVQYETAIYQALTDKSFKFDEKKPVVIMVVGAGRGPLVNCSIRAATKANKTIKLYAIEKNPNAVITLQSIKAKDWGDKVTIVFADMRDWSPEEKADLLVSELLGSFGDNELSPECLDGAQRFLKSTGISIPCKYTSYISPISSSKLYNEVKAYNDLKHFETAYVVKIHNACQLSESMELFTFVHPNSDPVTDNSRFKTVSFNIKTNAIIHGIAGYFDAQLFGDIHISINPQTYSKGMFSWFPLFFPLRNPIYIPPDSIVEINFWRRVGKTKVWYEWSVTSPTVTPIHNTNGRSYFQTM